jgi:hypothetical protein
VKFPTRLRTVGIEVIEAIQSFPHTFVHQVSGGVCAGLHFTENHAALVALAIHVKYLGVKSGLRKSRKEDVIEIHRQETQKAFWASGTLDEGERPSRQIL